MEHTSQGNEVVEGGVVPPARNSAGRSDLSGGRMTKAERQKLADKLSELDRLIAASPTRMTSDGGAYKVLVPGWARAALCHAADFLEAE